MELLLMQVWNLFFYVVKSSLLSSFPKGTCSAHYGGNLMKDFESFYRTCTSNCERGAAKKAHNLMRKISFDSIDYIFSPSEAYLRHSFVLCCSNVTDNEELFSKITSGIIFEIFLDTTNPKKKRKKRHKLSTFFSCPWKFSSSDNSI